MIIRMVYHVLNSGQRTLAIKRFPLDLDIQEWANKRAEAFRLLGIKAIEYEDVKYETP